MSAFGVIFSRYQLERAILSTLQTPPPGATASLLAYYVAESERQQGLAPQTIPLPPGPSSYRGGVDAGTLMAEWFPMVTVTAQPAGDAQRLDRYTLAQAYEAQVVCTAGDDSEQAARMVADAYGASVAKLIMDFGTLGIGATDTRVTRMADIALLDATNARQVCRATVHVQTLIAPALETSPPSAWPASPYTPAAQWPTVQTVNNVTVTATKP